MFQLYQCIFKESEMSISTDELRFKVDLLEQLLSRKELSRLSVSNKFKKLRRKLNKYLLATL